MGVLINTKHEFNVFRYLAGKEGGEPCPALVVLAF